MPRLASASFIDFSVTSPSCVILAILSAAIAAFPFLKGSCGLLCLAAMYARSNHVVWLRSSTDSLSLFLKAPLHTDMSLATLRASVPINDFNLSSFSCTKSDPLIPRREYNSFKLRTAASIFSTSKAALSFSPRVSMAFTSLRYCACSPSHASAGIPKAVSSLSAIS